MKPDTLMVKSLMKLSAWLNATCKDTGPLVSETMDHSLPLSKRWRMKFHLAICEACRHYASQLKTLRALAERLGKEDAPADPATKLSPEAKEKIQQALKNSK